MTPMSLRLNRRSGCRRCLNTSRLVGGVGGKGCGRCGGEEGGGGGGDCGGRANGGAGGGGPWSVSASSSSSLPKNCAADSFIPAQLNCPAAVVRACPAAPLHRDRAACRFSHSSLRDLRVLKEGWVSSRLLCGQLLCSRYVAGCSGASCSVAGCSVVMRPVRLVGAR